MPKLEPPPEVQRIFEKPGREWTPEERRRVYIWLFEEYWLRDLLTFALRNLGNGATFQDAEDAWDDFCVQRLEAVIANYDPQKARKKEQETQEAERLEAVITNSEKPNNFCGYLKFSFARYCWDKGEQIRKRRQRTTSLDEMVEDEEGEQPRLELAAEHPNSNPQKVAERQVFLEALNECLWALKNSGHRQVFILRDIQGLSEQETAAILGKPPNLVKVWLRRARLHLRDCLRAKGWEMP